MHASSLQKSNQAKMVTTAKTRFHYLSIPNGYHLKAVFGEIKSRLFSNDINHCSLTKWEEKQGRF